MSKYKKNNKHALALAAACLLLAGCYGGETSKSGSSAERMANASIVIVTAVAVQQVFGEATISAKVKRRMDFDSKIEGVVTPEELNVRMKMPLQDNVFEAHKTDGLWTGVDILPRPKRRGFLLRLERARPASRSLRWVPAAGG